MNNIENRIAKLLNEDVETLTIIRQDESQYLVSTKKFKNYIYDEIKDALLDMETYNNKDKNQDKDKLYEKFLTEEEKTQYYIDNQGLIGFALRKINILDGIEIEELRDICIYGFAKALNTFNKKAGIRFSTYCVKCMLNEMYYYLRKEQKKLQQNVSFDKTLSTDADGNSLTVGDLISDIKHNNGKSSEDQILNNELRSVLYECLSHLEDDEQFLIINRYGLENGGAVLTQSKIAEHLEMSQANVSKLEKTCLRKMRLIMRKLHYEYDAKNKKLAYSMNLDYDFGADNKYNHLDRNSDENVLLITCEKLKLNIDEVVDVKPTNIKNEFYVSFAQNNRIYGIVNTITEHVDLRVKHLSNEDCFMSFVFHTPYIGIPDKSMIETDEYNITYSIDDLKHAMKKLTKNEQYVLSNMYGLFQDKHETTSQMADHLKLTTDDIIKLKKDGYKKIEEYFS